MNKPVIKFTKNNMKSLTKFIGFRVGMNKEVISCLESLTNNEREPGLQEFKRLFEMQKSIQWEIE